MKITLEVPDTVMLVTYQIVYDDPDSLNLKAQQFTLDSNKLRELREVEG